MVWKKVAVLEIRGTIICVKDAMIMFSEDENKTPEYPCIECKSGEYVVEILSSDSLTIQKSRIRSRNSNPTTDSSIGSVEVDHGFIGFVDYQPFISVVRTEFEAYGDWTAMELDDALTENVAGVIDFQEALIGYVKAGDGDGVYECYRLVENGEPVGAEVVFV